MIRLQNNLERQALRLDVPSDRDIYSDAVLRQVAKGMDFSDLGELDISDANQRALFQGMARIATQAQQKKILDSATPDQIRLLAETLAEAGQRPNKAIMDSLTQRERDNVYEIQLRVRYEREGDAPIVARQRAARARQRQEQTDENEGEFRRN